MGTSVGITVPLGFAVNVFARGLNQPTALAFGPTGHLYVAELGGRIRRLEDRDGDGKAEAAVTFASGFRSITGIALRGPELYVSSRGTVTVLRDRDGDGRAEERQEIISGLPVGDHQNNGPVFGPDGKLYLPVGSTCNACQERDPRSATVMRFDPDGSKGEVYARGLRNIYQLAFHPGDGTLWGADNGRDDVGLEVPEELNLIIQGGHYGWPPCWGQGKGNACAGTVPPIVELEPRSSADGLVFYTSQQFPQAYRGNIFIALWGSNPDVIEKYGRSWGRRVVRVALEKREGRYFGEAKDFALGFDRPLALAVDGTGALLVADYGTGAIYRVYYVGGRP